MEGGLGVLQVPGHHHDAGLEDQLTRGLGQGPQAGQHSMSDDHIQTTNISYTIYGPCYVLEFHKGCFSVPYLIDVPNYQ